MTSSDKFRFYASQIYLTYSQIGDRTVDDFCNFFRCLSHPLDKFIVGLELHEDGGRHIHVYALYESRFQTKKVRFWDWDGLHPNVKTIAGRPGGKDAKRVYDYVTKDGNTTVWPEGAEFSFDTSNVASKYATVLAAGSKEEAKSIIMQELPRDYVVNLERVEYFLERHFRPELPVFVSPYDSNSFNVCQVMEQWVRDNLGYVFGSGRSTTY